MLAKTPTSSLTGDPTFHSTIKFIDTAIASELFVNRLWYRTKAKIKQSLCGGTPEAPTACPSPITKLPQELVEIIISYFVHDKRSLLACSRTCYSWYIASVSYLHHSLTTDGQPDDYHRVVRENTWPRPLRKSHELGLLPLVKRFGIRLGRSSYPGFASNRLSGRTLRCFSALTNLQELGIDHLQVPSFMPNIRRYFGAFSPTLRFLALGSPAGSCRQILYFIGLFPNLQDLKINYPLPNDEQESEADAALIPPSIPPLRGRLILTCFTRENLVKDMIVLFGGLRFRHMDLYRVKCVRLLLDACTETLETLRLYPTDPYGEEFLERRRKQTQVIYRKRPHHASTFRSVAEQMPPNTRDYGGIN